MRCKLLISTSLLLLCGFSGFAQNFSNKGKEFWVGYGHHQYMEPSCDGAGAATNDMNMVIYLSAEEPATVTVTIDSSGSAPFVPAWKRIYVIPAYTVISTENLPKGPVDAAKSGSDVNYDARLFDNAPPIGSGGENLWRKKGIHIESNVPIVAYAHIYGGVSSGATMLMPVNTWGYSYTSVNSEQRDADRSYSWMYVIARENNTLVEITPSAPSRRGKPAGVPFSVLIQKGQIYQLVAQSDCSTGNGPELTGTTVKSLAGPDGKCHPVAVFGGSSRTGGETLTCGTGSGRDNDMQQLFPEHAWGKRFATTPFSKSQGSTLQPSQFQTSVYKVVVKDPSTIVKRNGTTLGGLIGGKYYKFSSKTADYIVADKPVMIAQFMSGTSACNGGDGDPEMIIISPLEQSIKQVGFYRNTKEAINANYLTLVVPTAGVASLRIDNSPTFSYTYTHTNLPGYTVVVKGWASAQSQCLVRCDSGFTAITYGLGGAESYGYNAGTYINNLSAIGSIHNTFDTSKVDNSFTCTRTPVQLSVLMAFKPLQMEWLISKLSTVITPGANVLVNPPVVIDSPLVNGIKYYKYSLPGDFSFSDTGTFKIPIVVTSPSIDNCTQTDTVYYDIIVKGKPVADFTYTHSGCYTDTVYFTGSGTTGNYTINRWRWEFPGPGLDSIQSPKRILAVGPNTIKLQVISQEGCLGDTIKTVTIAPPPTTDFNATPVSVCEPASYNFVSTTAAGPGVSFYWDFGNGITSSGATSTASNVYSSYGTYTVKHVARTAGQCPTDTARKTVTIFANPRLNFNYPVGCLAADGTAQFSDLTVNPDGQTLTYAWDFGDANATTGNPNTANAQNPTHKYIAFGTYNIRLTVTTNNGCSKDTTIACTFAVRPVMAFAPLASVCANALPVSVAKGSTTNGVPGTGVYKGPGTDSLGNFNPTVAGAGIKTIWFVFTSTGGCVDSISQTIKVHPKPSAVFRVSDTSFCQNGATNITDNSAITSGAITQWRWTFGDGNIANNNNNTPFTHAYTTANNFVIKLVAISDSSCVSDTVSKTVKVNQLPVSSFNFMHTGCRLDTVYFTNTVPINTYTISKWKWQFSNGDTSVLPNPRIVFAAGNFTARLTVTTTDGCAADSLQSFTVSNPPVAGFTASPLSQCEPGTVNFSDASVYLGSGAIVKSYWSYGNGNLVNNNDNSAVTETYPGYGNYTIKHVVKISDLCISDTATKVVTVFANPRVKFGYPVGCLPLDNTARFSDSTIIPDGQTVTYTWNFGDPNANAGNPNISTQKNPSHIYSSYGTYDIKLTVTTINGCSKDTMITAIFAVRPLLSFAPLGSLCTSGGAVSVAKANVTNGVPGTGIYKGPGTNAAGNFDPAVAGTGSKTIWYVFTSAGGCTDSVSQSIKVFPKPVAAINLSTASFCADKTTTLTGSSTLTSGSTAEYHWNFGDLTTGNYPTNAPLVKSYPYGSYLVSMVSVSDSSCVSDTVAKMVTVNPLPQVDFMMPSSICMPAGKAQFTNMASIPGNGNLSYVWDFGDGSPTTTAKDPLHVFGASGSYDVRLTATSASGCFKDTVRTLSTFFDQPIALFAVVPDTLCQGTPNTFTDLSTASNSTISSWSWSFGDGSFSTQSTPLKKFSLPGTYPIKLLVTSAQGCMSDTFGRTVQVYLQPVINAGPSFTVPQGQVISFSPASNDTSMLRFVWSPTSDFTDATKFHQTITALRDQVYFLTAIGDGNCTATDSLVVKVLKPLKIPNVFSPNGDGINDFWEIPNLGDYPGARVTIFDRYGREVYTVTGYSKAWDGTVTGKQLPVGVYYYIIDPKNGFKPFTGSVTILR
ncbi:MAG: PKD domain-containing protein [Chitinophagaceae bacterium]